MDLFENETTMDAGDVGGGVEPGAEAATGAAEGAAEVASEAAAAPSPTPAAAPTFDLSAPEVQQQLAELSQAQTIHLLRELGIVQDAPEPDPFADFDPLDPQSIAGLLNDLLDKRLGPVEGLVQERQQEHFESTVGQMLDELVPTADGVPADELAHQREGIRFLGEAFASRVQGAGPQAVKQALQQGQQWLTAHDERVGKAAVDRYIASLNNNGDQGQTPYEPGVHGSAVEGLPRYRDETHFARAVAARTRV